MSNFDDLLPGTSRAPASNPWGDGGFGGGFNDDDMSGPNPFADMGSSSYVTASTTGFDDGDDLYRPSVEEEPVLPPPEPEQEEEEDQTPFDDGVLEYKAPPPDPTRFDIPGPGIVEEEDFASHLREPSPDPIGEMMRSGGAQGRRPSPESSTSSPAAERSFPSPRPPRLSHPGPEASPPPSSGPGFRTYGALPRQREPQSPQSAAKPAPPPEPPVFRPFGVSATLASDAPDEEEPEDPLANRPALPDILGGSLMEEGPAARLPMFGMPAFKPRAKKASEEGKGVDKKEGADPGQKPASAGPSKPYRPHGLKRAELKPVMPRESPPPAPSAAPPSEDQVTASSSSAAPIPAATPAQSTLVTDGPLAVPPASAPAYAPPEAAPRTATPTSTPTTTPAPAAAAAAAPAAPAAAPAAAPPPASSPAAPQNIALPASPPQMATATSAASVRTTSSTAAIRSRPGSPRRSSEGGDADGGTSPTTAANRVVVSPMEGKGVHNVGPILAPTGATKKREDEDSEDERPLASVKRDLEAQAQAQAQAQTQARPPSRYRRVSRDGSATVGAGAGVSNGAGPGAGTGRPAGESLKNGVTPIQTGQARPPPPPLVPPPPPRYTCAVGDPQKMGGLNDIHTVYTVKTKASDPADGGGPLKPVSTVLRRFNDFVWLFEALTHNNPGVIVPPIPDKNLRSRFQENFIAARRVALEIFLNKTANHPMLVSDPDLKLFLESDSFALEIKHRRPDPLVQQSWLSNLGGPRFVEFDDFYDQRRAYLDGLESQLRALHSSMHSAAKSRLVLAQSLGDLSVAILALSSCDLSKPMRHSIERLAALQKQLRDWGETQAREEEEGLSATVESYARLVGSVRSTFGGRVKGWEKWQLAQQHLRKVQANYEKNKRANGGMVAGLQHSLAELSDAERKAHDAKNEFEDVSKLIKAEMQRFDKEKVDDFKAAVCGYVDGMYSRQRLVVQAWQDYYHVLQSVAKANAATEPAKAKSSNGTVPDAPAPSPADV